MLWRGDYANDDDLTKVDDDKEDDDDGNDEDDHTNYTSSRGDGGEAEGANASNGGHLPHHTHRVQCQGDDDGDHDFPMFSAIIALIFRVFSTTSNLRIELLTRLLMSISPKVTVVATMIFSFKSHFCLFEHLIFFQLFPTGSLK